MSKKTVEIFLKSLQVKENGEIRDEPGNNALLVSLLYNDIPDINTAREIPLVRGKEFKGEELPGLEPLLFKTEINFYTWVKVVVSNSINRKAIDKFFTNLIGKLYDTTFGILFGGISNVLLKISTDSIYENILGPLEDESTFIIGESLQKITTTELPAPGQEKDFILNLTAPFKVTRKKITGYDQNGKAKLEAVKILTRGQENGQLVLTLKTLG